MMLSAGTGGLESRVFHSTPSTESRFFAESMGWLLSTRLANTSEPRPELQLPTNPELCKTC